MNERHAELDNLAAKIKAAERTYESAYHAWVMAGNNLRRLERDHRKIWTDLFERQSSTDFSKLRQMTTDEVAEVTSRATPADAETVERRLTRSWTD